MYARRALVRKDLLSDLKELDGQDADVAQLLEHARGIRFGLSLERRGEIGRRSPRDVQDAVAVLILDERIKCCLAANAANREDRKLAREGYKAFEDERLSAQLLPAAFDVCSLAQHELPLA